jgi:hypothetical protein
MCLLQDRFYIKRISGLPLKAVGDYNAMLRVRCNVGALFLRCVTTRDGGLWQRLPHAFPEATCERSR